MHRPGADGAQRPERARDRLDEAAGGDADDLALCAGRIGEGAEQVEDRAEAQLLADRQHVAHGRVVGRREQEADAGLVQRAPLLVGVAAMLTPRAVSTSDEPDFDEMARFPCLATFSPAPAATKPTAVEMFNVCSPSPPVPQTSITS